MGGLASAKAKLAKVARGLRKGDAVTVTNRLYAIVSAKGKLQFDKGAAEQGSGYPDVAIYSTRRGAQLARREGERVIRLGDISGIVQ